VEVAVDVVSGWVVNPREARFVQALRPPLGAPIVVARPQFGAEPPLPNDPAVGRIGHAQRRGEPKTGEAVGVNQRTRHAAPGACRTSR
jgi:hypothetical protein